MIGLGENRRPVDRGPRRGHGARLCLFRIFRLGSTGGLSITRISEWGMLCHRFVIILGFLYVEIAKIAHTKKYPVGI